MTLLLLIIAGAIIHAGSTLSKPITHSSKFDVNFSQRSYHVKIDNYLESKCKTDNFNRRVPIFKVKKLATKKTTDHVEPNTEYDLLVKTVIENLAKKNYSKTYVTKRGYERYKNGGPFVHRLVMENKIGRKLTKEERVHHNDGDKLNNDPNNLRLFKNQYEHNKYHEKCKAETGNWYGIISRSYSYQNTSI